MLKMTSVQTKDMDLCSTTWHNGTKIPQLTSIQQLKEMLRNYDGTFLKVDGAYVVDVNLEEMWFDSRQELLRNMSWYCFNWGMEF